VYGSHGGFTKADIDAMDQAEVFRYTQRLAEQRKKENEARDEANRKAAKGAKKNQTPLWKRLTGHR